MTESRRDRAVTIVSEIERRALAGEDISSEAMADLMLQHALSSDDVSSLVIEVRNVFIARGYDMEIVLDDSGPRLEDPVDDFLARLGVAPGARELAVALEPGQARSGGSGCLGTALLVLTVALAIFVATMV